MKFVKLFVLSLLPLAAFGQIDPGLQPPLPFIKVQNDTSTGTVCNKLVKLNSSGQAVRASTSDTSGVIGVAVGNCGTTGEATIAYAGKWPVIADGTTVTGHYLKISASVAGDVADSGASTYPTSGQVIGRVIVANTVGLPSTVMLGAEVQAAANASVPLTSGTSVTLTGPYAFYVCTSTCTVTLPVPVAGYQFCIRNGNNVSTVITLAALGSSARYENTANTAYGTAGTGTFVSSGAAGDKVCVVGLDSTHYLTMSNAGTWTAN